MNGLRRYELLVPLLFNDGRPVPEALLAQTFVELREKFGAASWETQTVRGAWEHQGAVYEDNLTRFFVDVADLPEHREFSGSSRRRSSSASTNWRFGSLRTRWM